MKPCRLKSDPSFDRGFCRRLGIREGSGAKSAVFQFVSTVDLGVSSPSNLRFHAQTENITLALSSPGHHARLLCSVQKAQTRVFAGKRAALCEPYVSDNRRRIRVGHVFFQILESRSLVKLHTKFGGSDFKGRKNCHWEGCSMTDGSGQTVRL